MNETEKSSSNLIPILLIVFFGLLSFVLMIAALLLPLIGAARDNERQNVCRNNMRNLAMANFNYANRSGTYPGYMNTLQLQNGKAYVEPGASGPTPVSWVVMVLPDLDRAQLFQQWTKPPSPSSTPSSYNRVYIEMLTCPSDPQATKSGTPISYVVNTGMPDAPATTVGDGKSNYGVPRDWAANGMFFDNFSDHPLVKLDKAQRGPMVYMRDEMVRDPKDKTILLTENVDATEYVLNAASQAADGWRAVEVQTGCIWRPNKVTTGKPPQMPPPAPTLQPNGGMGTGDGLDFNYCRPSSRHPGLVNVAFVGQNVMALNDKISYFVYAKLMASDDNGVKPAGQLRGAGDMEIDKTFHQYPLMDADMFP